ncbi:MAG TPA: TetR/AcrR family transcriptional regulator [Bacilli bacterium]|nr:TetR/AcrR family transcriptional regulator [Bacilli bacterium]
MAVNRRQDILNAATQSFSLFGYKATTMDQVAKLASVGKGTIYTFFANKEELFNEIITKLIADMQQKATGVIVPGEKFQDNVHHALVEMLDFRRDHQLMIKLIQEQRDIGTPIVNNVLDKVEESILTFIRDKIEIAIQRGEIKKCDPDIFAYIILVTYISLIFDWEKSREPLSKEEIAEIFQTYIFNGLSLR